MPRPLCAAKRQIKETVISSAASSADSSAAMAEGCLLTEARRRGEGVVQHGAEKESHGNNEKKRKTDEGEER